jgi:carbohydrate-selective porin OprB
MGWAQIFPRKSSSTAASEGVFELYYRARLTPWLHISPHMQYIENPGMSDADDALTLGIRGQVTF